MFSFFVGEGDFSVPDSIHTGSGTHRNSCVVGIRALSMGLIIHIMKLTTHISLALRSGTHGAVPSIPCT